MPLTRGNLAFVLYLSYFISSLYQIFVCVFTKFFLPTNLFGLLYLPLQLEGEETLIYCCVCHIEKFNTVTTMDSHKCDFSVLDRKYPFWANLV